MYIYSELNSIDLKDFGANNKLKAQYKLSSGSEMLDLRMWRKYAQDHQFHPTNNGIFIEMKEFKALLPTLIEFVTSSQSGSKESI